MSHAAALLLAFFGVAAPALSAEPVHLAVPLSLQPYYIPLSDEGLAYETLVAAFAARGRTVLSIYVSDRQNAKVLDRHPKVDCSVLQSQADSEKWFAVDEVYPLHDYVATLASSNLTIDDVVDLKDKSVIGYQGASEQLGAELRAAIQENPYYREINNHRAQVKLLLNKRVQAIIADKLLVEWYLDYLAEEYGERVQVIYHDLFPPSRLKFTCRGRAFLEDFAAGLEDIKRSGQLDAIRSRYLK